MWRNLSQRAGVWGAMVASIVAMLVLYGFALWFGNLNQDEGWYLYAARSCAEGSWPYRDFFFTQGPVMPVVYGWFAKLWLPYGVLGGRGLTALLGVVGAVLASQLARRASRVARHGREAALLGLALVGCNLYHVYFTTIPKTYALAGVLVLGGYLVLTLVELRGRRSRSPLAGMWGIPAGVLLALAGGTRLSLVLLLPVTALWLLLWCVRFRSAFFWFTLGGALGLALVFGPVWQHSWEQFSFAQSFHVERGGRDLMFMAGSLSRIVRGYLGTVVVGLLLVVVRWFGVWRGAGKFERGEERGYQGYLWPQLWLLGFVVVFVFQLLTPFPYDDYQVPLMGLCGAALAGLVGCIPVCRVRRGVALIGVGGVLAASFGSSLLQEWLVVRQDRFWVVKKECSDLEQLRSCAVEIRELAGGDDMLLTQDVYLALEAGMRVPAGMEMGPFSYFPELSDEDAVKMRVLNRGGMERVLREAGAGVAAISGYGLSIRSPVMDEVPYAERQGFFAMLGVNYDLVAEVDDFGQHCTRLQIFRRRVALSGDGSGGK